jgi:hypothetical protein
MFEDNLDECRWVLFDLENKLVSSLLSHHCWGKKLKLCDSLKVYMPFFKNGQGLAIRLCTPDGEGGFN